MGYTLLYIYYHYIYYNPGALLVCAQQQEHRRKRPGGIGQQVGEVTAAPQPHQLLCQLYGSPRRWR